jgi:hypothetical protein
MHMFQLVSVGVHYIVESRINVIQGTTLSAIHFVPGQFVDVVANSWVLLFLIEDKSSRVT